MKHTLHIYLGVLLCFFPTGCKSEITLKVLDLPPKIVLNSMISPDSVVVAYVSRTIPLSGNNYYFDDEKHQEAYYINDAEIKMYVNDNYSGVMKKHIQSGEYILSGYKPVSGSRIRMEAEVSGYDPVRSETVIPYPPVVLATDTLTIPYVYTSWGEKESYSLQLRFDITFLDNDAEKNYYLIQFSSTEEYEREEGITVNLKNIYINPEKDLLFDHDGTFTSGHTYFSPMGYVFTDDIFDGREYSISFITDQQSYSYQSDTLTYTNTVQVDFYQISFSYYLYLRSKAIQYEQNDFFGEIGLREPMPTFTNVRGGYGIMGGREKVSYRYVLPFGKEPPQSWY